MNNNDLLELIDAQHFYLRCISHSIYDIRSAGFEELEEKTIKWFSHESFTILNTLSHVIEKNDYQYTGISKYNNRKAMNNEWYRRKGEEYLLSIWKYILEQIKLSDIKQMTIWQSNQIKTALHRSNNSKEEHKKLCCLLDKNNQENFWEWRIENKFNYI